jgi:hypothetical protein
MPGIAGVFIKITEGFTADPAHVAHIKLAEARGIPWGPSGKPSIEVGDAAGQAFMMWTRALEAGTPSLVPSGDMDMVSVPAGIPNRVCAEFYREWCDTLIELGVTPSVYTLNNNWNRRVAPVGISFSDCPLRSADFREPAPADSADWETWLRDQVPPDHVHGWPMWDWDDTDEGAWQFNCDVVCKNLVKPGTWRRMQRHAG